MKHKERDQHKERDHRIAMAIKESIALMKLRKKLGHRYDVQCKCELCQKERRLKLDKALEARNG